MCDLQCERSTVLCVISVCGSKLKDKYKQVLQECGREDFDEEMRSLSLSDEEHSFVSAVSSYFDVMECTFVFDLCLNDLSPSLFYSNYVCFIYNCIALGNCWDKIGFVNGTPAA